MFSCLLTDYLLVPGIGRHDEDERENVRAGDALLPPADRIQQGLSLEVRATKFSIFKEGPHWTSPY